MVPLIDTHLHLILPDKFSYSWLEQAPALQNAATLEDYTEITKGLGVSSALFMEVDVDENNSAAEAYYFSQISAKPDTSLNGVIASARPEKEGFSDYLRSIALPHLKGIRRVLHVADDSTSQSPLFRENIRLLAKHNLPFDLCILPRQHAIGLDLIDACPETRFVLDHCGNPSLADPDSLDPWRSSLKQLAERPNVFAKLSGIVASSSEKPATLAIVKPYLDATLEAFGPSRVLWGSDWPVCTLTTSLADWITIFRNWLSALSPDEQKQIANQNATSCYSLSSQSDPTKFYS